VLVGWLLGVVVDTPVVAASNAQVAARVTPRLVDLLAALATGAVGSVALARDDISDTLPGVAIAISLVPPLAVVGLTLESGAGDQALGALLLFATNVTAILATGLVVMALYRVHRRVTVTPEGRERRVHRGRAVVVILAGLVVIAVPLAATSRSITIRTSTENAVTEVVTRWANDGGWDVGSVATRPDGVLVRATGPLPEPDSGVLRADLDRAGLADTTVKVELIPSRTVEITPGR